MNAVRRLSSSSFSRSHGFVTHCQRSSLLSASHQPSTTAATTMSYHPLGTIPWTSPSSPSAPRSSVWTSSSVINVRTFSFASASSLSSSLSWSPFTHLLRPKHIRQQQQVQQRRFISKYISKSAKKRLPMTTKRAGKGFYKGKGSTKEGTINSRGRFIANPLRKLQLVVPDLEGFTLKPYVSRSASKVPPELRR